MTMNIKQQLEWFCCPYLAEEAPQYLARVRGRIASKSRITTKDLVEVVQVMAAYHINRTGIKIIEVSEDEAELYANTNLSGIDPMEWRQSYPMVLVLTGEVLTGVLHMPEIEFKGEPLYPLHLLEYPRPGIVDHVFTSSNIEAAFANDVTALPGQTVGLNSTRGRIACNAVMHLANYPDLYGRHPQASNRILVRKNVSGVTKRKELIPQIIRLRAPVEREDQKHTLALVGHGKRPHWRRGHWRQAAVGAGWVERRHVWIRPMLIHSEAIVGDKAGASLFVA